MTSVNIYGGLKDGASIIIGSGNFNSVSNILTYSNDIIHLQPIINVITPTIIEFIINHETPVNALPNKFYFSLRAKQSNLIMNKDQLNKDQDRYLGVKMEISKEQVVQASACISFDKTLFSIDYSAVDRNFRPQLLAGNLYSLETVIGERPYIVSWKYENETEGNLIILLPTTWYESNNICEQYTGVNLLLQRLEQIQFKGFTTSRWCEKMNNTVHCTSDNLCGDCFGQCLDPSHICYPNLIGNNLIGNNLIANNFICGPNSSAPNMEQTEVIATTSEPPPTTGTGATWVAVIIIFAIVLLLAWGLNTGLKIE